jgi:hypothetical protein
MTGAVQVEPRPHPRRRWWGLVVVVFALQLGLIFWLGARTPPQRRQVANAPALQLAGTAALEQLGLSDPTLFALPHQHGFSGAAWLSVPQPEFQSFEWSAPPRWLQLPLNQLGATFNEFIQTNNPGSSPSPPQPEPELTVPDSAPVALSRQRSELLLVDDLARRRLLAPPQLPSFRHTDILSNSVVQMAVDAQGKAVSFTLIPPGSGSAEADQYALKEARAARFEPLSAGGPELPASRAAQLTWGKMIFEWHTLPVPPANPPAAGP